MTEKINVTVEKHGCGSGCLTFLIVAALLGFVIQNWVFFLVAGCFGLAGVAFYSAYKTKKRGAQ